MGRKTQMSERGEVTVPPEILDKPGAGPGDELEWELRGDEVVVRRREPSIFLDIHKDLFPDGPPAPKTAEESKQALRESIVDHWESRVQKSR